MGDRRTGRGGSKAAVLAALMATVMPAAAFAQADVASGAQAARAFDIAAQPLPAALAAWSARTGIRVQSIPEAAQRASGSAVSGTMSAIAALDLILQGSGYSFRFTRVDVVVIEPAVAATGTIGTVRVQGTADIATQGVNGSTDPTATEGSDSYAADQTTIATKMPLAMKDTPQTVSVVTSQQLADRNVTDLQRALAEAPGITVLYSDSGGVNSGRNNLQPSFFSRGFEIQRLQIDGGAPLAIGTGAGVAGQLVPQLNMAAYDHIEILRGADGLFDGSGAPGGAINLTRKRPVDHAQLLVSQLVETWNGFNTAIDGSAPLTSDGKLRARVVLNRQSNDYFYDTAKNKQFMVYATIEAQVTPTTTIAGGINYQTQDSVPFYNGLTGGIRDGRVIDLNLPRSSCFCFDFNRQSYDTRDLFGRIEQSFGGDWRLKINGTLTRQTSDYSYAGVVGTYGSADSFNQPRLFDGFGRNSSRQYTLDGTLNGSFKLFGQKQQLVLGVNTFSFDGGGQLIYAPAYRFGGPAVDPFNFDQADYDEPDHSSQPIGVIDVNRTSQLGAYGTFRFTPVKPLHFSVGARYNRYSGRLKTYNICRDEFGFGCFDPATGNSVADGAQYNFVNTSDRTSKFFPAGYLAATLDITPTLSAYASKTAIYVDNSGYADVDGKTLGPTTGNNWEAGVKYASADHRRTASIAVYRVSQRGLPLGIGTGGNPDVDPITGKLPDGRFCCFIGNPDAGQINKGIDVELAGELFAGMQLSGSYVYSDNKILVPAGQPEPLAAESPRHLYKAWLKYTFQPGSALKGGYVGAGVQGQSEGFAGGDVCTVPDEFGSGCSFEPGSTTRFNSRLAPRAIATLMAGWEFNRKLSLAVTLNNVFDKRYYNSVGLIDGGNWYGAPRNVSIALRGSF